MAHLRAPPKLPQGVTITLSPLNKQGYQIMRPELSPHGLAQLPAPRQLRHGILKQLRVPTAVQRVPAAGPIYVVDDVFELVNQLFEFLDAILAEITAPR